MLPAFYNLEDSLKSQRTVRRSRCYLDHSRCTWKCRVYSQGSDYDLSKQKVEKDLFVSKTFHIIYHNDRVSLSSGVIFQIQVDDVTDPKGGIDSANPYTDYQDAHLEFTLSFAVGDQ